MSPNVLDYIPLADDYMICEIAPPSGFIGKTLAELQLRNKYHIDVIAVRDMLTEKINMVPAANFIVKDSEVLIVVGKEDGYRQNKIRVCLVFLVYLVCLVRLVGFKIPGPADCLHMICLFSRSLTRKTK